MIKFTTIGQAKKQIGLTYLGITNISSKLVKNVKVNKVLTYCMYFAPASESGYNVCSHSTPECRLGCLATSGLTKVEIYSNKNTIRNARIKRTKLFYENPEFFFQWLIAEIKASQNKAIKQGLMFGVRLNGTSDIDWANIKYEGKNIFEHFPEIQFYDYTKVYDKFVKKPSNYHLTFSFTGYNWDKCKILLRSDHNVAVVFDVKKGNDLPATFNGYQVIDGDLTDYRPSDPQGVIVGLRFKNIADKEAKNKVLNSCFVVKI
jgi:hypothetical protein